MVSVFDSDNVSILLYAVDLAFEIYLFGIYQPDRTLKEARKVKANTKRARFDDINERNTKHQHSINKLIIKAKNIGIISSIVFIPNIQINHLYPIFGPIPKSPDV